MPILHSKVNGNTKKTVYPSCIKSLVATLNIDNLAILLQGMFKLNKNT